MVLASLALLVAAAQLSASVRIGIVGGGVGGTSAAYFIRELFKDDADIHLFEKSRIGGRLDIIDVNNFQYETGGSIIHTKNKYMMDFIDKFGLSRKTAGDSDTFGLFDGSSLVFESSSWSLITTAKLFWRYGYEVIRLQRLIDQILQKFSRIYDLLDSGAAYDTVEDLVIAMEPSLLKLTELPLAQYLKLSGFSDRFIDELVSAATLTNYGQRPNVHAFVGMVAVTGVGADLTSVSGGNYQVAVKALEASGATVHQEDVQLVNFTGSTFTVTSSSADDVTHTREYDILVVAAPQTSDHVRIRWEGLAPFNLTGRYVNLSVTLVDGELSPAAFSASSLPEDLLATTNCREFNSIGQIQPTNQSSGPHALHKVFSSAPPSEDKLNQWFQTRRQVHRLHWLAYPEYSSRAELGNFTVRHGLYYTSSVEAAASAMEMSVIAARNVANLAYTRWYNRAPPDLRTVKHEEL